MTDGNINIVQPAARSGLILGFIGIIISLVIYFINPAMFANFWVGIVLLVMYLVLLVIFGINFRNQVGGWLSFKHAFLYSFIVLAVAGIIGQLFQYVLATVVDPELPEIVKRAAIDNTEAFLERFNAPQEQIDEQLEKTEAQFDSQYTLPGLAKGYLFALAIYAIVSLVTGAILRRKNPEEAI